MEKSFEDCVTEGALPEIENLRIYKEEKVYERISNGLIPQNNPTAILLGGQIASGKSTLSQKTHSEFDLKGKIAAVDGDALRDFHPLFKKYNSENDKLTAAYTSIDSNRWTEKLVNDLARDRCNMVVETTLKNKKVVTNFAEKLNDIGYDIQAKILIVSYEKSLLGAYARYEYGKTERGAGRFVPDHVLNASYTALPEALQALKEQNICSCVHLYTREGVLFEGDYRSTDIVALVKQERCREFTQNEIKFLTDGWKEVGDQMIARGASSDEFAEIIDRMGNRIKMMKIEGVDSNNIDTMTNIQRDFKKQFAKDFEINPR